MLNKSRPGLFKDTTAFELDVAIVGLVKSQHRQERRPLCWHLNVTGLLYQDRSRSVSVCISRAIFNPSINNSAQACHSLQI